jgi:hypothetical protein
MQKNPPDFVDWMYFHLSVGVWGFILRMEDPDPQLQDLLKSLADILGPRFQAMPEETAMNAGGLHDVMERAGEFVTKQAVPKARQLGLDFVLWIDADELIFPVCDSVVGTAFAVAPSYRRRGHNPACQVSPQKGWYPGCPDGALFAPVRDELAYLVFVNYEARFPNPHCQDEPFTTAGTRFQTDRRFYELYAEGKPAANAKNVHVKTEGPHVFTGGDYAPVPANLAVVLHFDSPGFDPWLTKWSRHAKGKSLADNKIGDSICVDKFPYYRESLEILMKPSTRAEQMALYSKFRCLPQTPEQIRGLVDFDILAKIHAGQCVTAPSLANLRPNGVLKPIDFSANVNGGKSIVETQHLQTHQLLTNQLTQYQPMQAAMTLKSIQPTPRTNAPQSARSMYPRPQYQTMTNVPQNGSAAYSLPQYMPTMSMPRISTGACLGQQCTNAKNQFLIPGSLPRYPVMVG